MRENNFIEKKNKKKQKKTGGFFFSLSLSRALRRLFHLL
jgi:hypothetical protein